MSQEAEKHHTAITIREASREDAPFIVEMIRELADYENALDKVEATAEGLEHWLFDEGACACLIASLDDSDAATPSGGASTAILPGGADNTAPPSANPTTRRDVGFALYFTNFSTWYGKPGIYLEDLYVRPEARGRGAGTALLRELARIVIERGYGCLEWYCLDWNEPSLDYYRSIGAVQQREWVRHRMQLAEVKRLAQGPTP